MNSKELIERMRGFEIDHDPDGWPGIRMREVSALCDALEKAEQERDALAAELLTPQVFTRIVEWLQQDPMPRAAQAFTAGIERQIAYALEMDVLPVVKSLRRRINAAPTAIMDTRDALGICAPTEEDFPALYALRGKRVRLVVEAI